MISVLILTLNEEANLPGCLESVRWSDDIVVLDSGSQDDTVRIAQAAGARVVTRSFDNEFNQRTYSVRELKFKYRWVYNPDADEIPEDSLCDEMRAVVADDSRSEVAYRVRFKTIFMGKWIRHSSLYPTWAMRLFRPERIGFERHVNLNYLADGPVGFLQSHFVHRSFEKGMNAWLAKHERYAREEAQESTAILEGKRLDSYGLFALSDPVRRRRALKALSYRLAFRPLLRFTYMYLIRCGFLDGRAGFEYSRLMANYERMIDRCVEQMKRNGGNQQQVK